MQAVDTVYVIGAGFSAGCGYPLTSTLLIDLWERLLPEDKSEIEKVIKFHHPSFDSAKKTSFPNIEQLLTEMDVNKKMFDMSRPGSGGFTKQKLEKLRKKLLIEVEKWFHELYEDAEKTKWLKKFKARIAKKNTAIISFNWDLLLDHLLFDSFTSSSYGLTPEINQYPLLLKPHGSLNWFHAKDLKHVKDEKRNVIFSKGSSQISAFIYPRRIQSKRREYAPIIVPPTFLKDFEHPIFENLWINCTQVLSTAKNIVFLGYSMPSADMQAKFILRCGFYNQISGPLDKNGQRLDPEKKPAEVIIVNPDQEAARRIEAIAGPKIPCIWVPKSTSDWLLDSKNS